jgi:hypothetical protein
MLSDTWFPVDESWTEEQQKVVRQIQRKEAKKLEKVETLKKAYADNAKEFARRISDWARLKDPRFVDGLVSKNGNVNMKMAGYLANINPEVRGMLARFQEDQANIKKKLEELSLPDAKIALAATQEISESSIPVEITEDLAQQALDEIAEVSRGKMRLNPKAEDAKPIVLKSLGKTTKEFEEEVRKSEEEQPFMPRPAKYEDDEEEETDVDTTWLPTDTSSQREKWKPRMPFFPEDFDEDVSPQMLEAWSEIKDAARIFGVLGGKPKLDSETEKLAEEFIAGTIKRRKNAFEAVTVQEEIE